MLFFSESFTDPLLLAKPGSTVFEYGNTIDAYFATEKDTVCPYSKDRWC